MILLHKQHIDRTLKRMTYQVAEEAKEMNIVLVGINDRGYTVAQSMSLHLSSIRQNTPHLYRVRDTSETSSEPLPPPPGNNNVLVIVDDVIFSGGTIYRSLQKIPELSTYKKILVTVLVDRGHRKYPLLASIVGLNTPTKLNEQVELHTRDNQPFEVVLTNK